jgi:hypothetical protein
MANVAAIAIGFVLGMVLMAYLISLVASWD